VVQEIDDILVLKEISKLIKDEFLLRTAGSCCPSCSSCASYTNAENGGGGGGGGSCRCGTTKTTAAALTTMSETWTIESKSSIPFALKARIQLLLQSHLDKIESLSWSLKTKSTTLETASSFSDNCDCRRYITLSVYDNNVLRFIFFPLEKVIRCITDTNSDPITIVDHDSKVALEEIVRFIDQKYK